MSELCKRCGGSGKLVNYEDRTISDHSCNICWGSGLMPEAPTILELNTRIAELEAEINRKCRWEKQTLSLYGEYDSWSTACGEDFAIEEEWHERPTKYCANCGGKTIDVTDQEQKDE